MCEWLSTESNACRSLICAVIDLMIRAEIGDAIGVYEEVEVLCSRDNAKKASFVSTSPCCTALVVMRLRVCEVQRALLGISLSTMEAHRMQMKKPRPEYAMLI